MSEKIGEAYVEVRADTDGMESGLRGAFGRIAGVAAAAFAGGQIAQFTGGLISAASDLGETTSQVGVIFGDSQQWITEWAKTTASSIGQSSNQAMQAAGTFATFGKMAGLNGTELAGFATNLTGLASDMASFKNTTPEEAINAIGAALRGESEPIRRYGVMLDDATLKNRAMAMGLISTTKDALTPQQKVLAAQAEIMAQTTDAQGDFARTSDGLANKQRILAAQFEDVKGKLGQALLPIATKVVGFLAENMGPAFDKVREAVGYFMGALNGETGEGSGFMRFMGRLGEITRVVVDRIVEWWPTIRAAIETAAEAAGRVLAWLGEEVLPRVVEAVRAVVDWVVEHWPQIQATVAAVVDWIAANVVPVVEEVVGNLVAKFGELVAWVQEVWPQVSATISAAVTIVRTIVTEVVDFVTALWRRWGDEITSMVTTYWGLVVDTIGNAISFVREIVQTVMALIRGDWGAAWDGIKGALGVVWDQIRSLVSTALSLLGSALSIAWDGIKAAAGIAWDGIKSVVSTAIDGVVDFVAKLPGRLLGFAGELGQAALDLGGKIVTKIGDGLKGLGEAIAKPFRDGWNAIASWWNSHVGNWSFTIPDWVPGIGGNGFDVPNLPKFHRGGVVPGGPNDETVAKLLGGEVVFRPDQLRALAAAGFGRGAGAGGGVTVQNANFYNELDIEAFGRIAGYAMMNAGVAA